MVRIWFIPNVVALTVVLTREALVLYPQSPSWVVEQLYRLPIKLSL